MLIYRLAIWIALPAICIQVIIHTLRHKDSRYFLHRLGFIRSSHPKPINAPLWFHCASVGETNAALPLINEWLSLHPQTTIVITTNTIPSAQVLNPLRSARLHHYYLPLDYPFWCQRFLNQIKPQSAFIIETEIWLNLFTACEKNHIPVIILNGRISKKTLPSSALMRKYYQLSLSKVARVYARSSTDALRYQALGVIPDRVSDYGNLKYAARFPSDLPRLVQAEYILAASTHPKEEEIIAEAYTHANTGKLLVIVPRHPQRGSTIKKKLRSLDCKIQLRSQNKTIEQDTAIYIADTIGELPAFIRHASLVFMGGSLINHGGQNVLEPAMLRVPQITGHQTHNFHEEVALLKSAGGLLEVADKTALIRTLMAFTANSKPFQEMADKAYTCVQQQQQNTLRRYLTAVKHECEK